MHEQVQRVLNGVKKTLMLHNGSIDLVDCDEARGVVTLRFTGNCAQCSLSSSTFTQGVERALYLGVPGLQEVILVG